MRTLDHTTAMLDDGEMAERTIASVLKTVEALRSPGVRIPLSPLFGWGRLRAAPIAVFSRFRWTTEESALSRQLGHRRFTAQAA